MINIDGSYGEGGGQILRTSLGLSLVTKIPFTLYNIRANRKRPGLQKQHLTCVKAAARISNAMLEGDYIGADRLVFYPDDVIPGEYEFDIGSAGSTTLVLQTILPGLIAANGQTKLTIKGGTHNTFAPPFDFISKSFFKILNMMGLHVDIKLLKWGFYPAGGGRIKIIINPVIKLKPVIINNCNITNKYCYCVVSNLPISIAEDEAKIIKEKLSLENINCKSFSVNTDGSGNIVMIELENEYFSEVITSFGARGIPRDKVALNAVNEAEVYIRSKAPVGVHLADQLLIPFAMAGSGEYYTVSPSLHTKTNIEIIKKFLNIDISIKNINNDLWTVKIK